MRVMLASLLLATQRSPAPKATAFRVGTDLDGGDDSIVASSSCRTVPAAASVTQTPPSPMAATPEGDPPTSIVASTSSPSARMRLTVPSSALATQTASLVGGQRAGAGTDLDGRHDLVARRVDPAHRAIEVVRHPDGIVGGDHRHRRRPDLDRRHHLGGRRGDPGDGAVEVIGHPDGVIGGGHADRVDAPTGTVARTSPEAGSMRVTVSFSELVAQTAACWWWPPPWGWRPHRPSRASASLVACVDAAQRPVEVVRHPNRVFGAGDRTGVRPHADRGRSPRVGSGRAPHHRRRPLGYQQPLRPRRDSNHGAPDRGHRGPTPGRRGFRSRQGFGPLTRGSGSGSVPGRIRPRPGYRLGLRLGLGFRFWLRFRWSGSRPGSGSGSGSGSGGRRLRLGLRRQG